MFYAFVARKSSRRDFKTKEAVKLQQRQGQPKPDPKYSKMQVTDNKIYKITEAIENLDLSQDRQIVRKT